MSDKWFNAVCWSPLLFGIFIVKTSVVLRLTSFGTLKFGTFNIQILLHIDLLYIDTFYQWPAGYLID